MGKDIEELKVWLGAKFDQINEKSQTQSDNIISVKINLEKLEGQLFECIISCSELKKENNLLKTENSQLRERLNDIDARSRMNSLRFFNIRESKDKTTMEVLTHFIENDLKIAHTDLIQARRLSTQKGNGQILARFRSEDDARKVRLAAFKRPKGSSNVGVEEDIPTDWVQIRQEAYHSHVKQAKAEGKRVRWAGSRLFINNVNINLKKERSDRLSDTSYEYLSTTPATTPSNPRFTSSTPMDQGQRKQPRSTRK